MLIFHLSFHLSLTYDSKIFSFSCQISRPAVGRTTNIIQVALNLSEGERLTFSFKLQIYSYSHTKSLLKMKQAGRLYK